MKIHELAGTPVPDDLIPNIPRLMANYYTHDPEAAVSFGTSGHRGTSLNGSFNEIHILAISQALCDVRREQNITGPMFVGMDTHALSEAALYTALEVLAANDVTIMLQEGMGYTPTPVISHAILKYNRNNPAQRADGIVITPSHNPPQDGGFKYNPPTGGPADTETTRQIQNRANLFIKNKLNGIKRTSIQRALNASTTKLVDFVRPYVEDLKKVINMDAIRESGLKIGVDPMGGSGISFWEPIADYYGLNIQLVNRRVDPTFSFMHLDKDGKIRMDCSSPYAMAGLIELKDKFDVAFGNDPDFDRHGIVTRSSGLLNPNHYLSVAVWYLFQNRPQWATQTGVGKTLVSSSMIDRVAAFIGRSLYEVPVGFKWFVDGLLNGDYGFGGEESAGASFICHDGSVWTTDKDGIIMDLLAAEITAVSGKDPGEIYQQLEDRFGRPVYERMDVPAEKKQKDILKNLNPQAVTASELAGEKIVSKLTTAPGNNAVIGGLKVITQNGWFAARPSGTEDIYKIYAESFNGRDHLRKIQEEAQQIVRRALNV